MIVGLRFLFAITPLFITLLFVASESTFAQDATECPAGTFPIYSEHGPDVVGCLGPNEWDGYAFAVAHSSK